MAGAGHRRHPLAGLPALDAGEGAWRQAWVDDPVLRAEFVAEGDFLGFMRAAARGAVRVR